MVRVMAIVEYDGTDFAGFQTQAHPVTQPRTVQQALEDGIYSATQSHVRVIGAGRTDSGVHAAGQVVHFDIDAPLAGEPGRFQRAINAHLPPDVTIHALRAVPGEFHARYSATSRTYTYRIYNAIMPSPLLRRYTHHVRAMLSVPAMDQGARFLVGSHDFRAFSAQDHSRSSRRIVIRTRVSQPAQTWSDRPPFWHTTVGGFGVESIPGPQCAEQPGGARLVEIEIEANAFLRHMMRRIAGTLIRVGEGRIAPEDVGAILASGEKIRAGPTASPQGLCLMGVRFSTHQPDGAESVEP